MKYTSLLILCFTISFELYAGPSFRKYGKKYPDTLSAMYIAGAQHWYENGQGIPFSYSFIVNKRWGGSVAVKKFFFKSMEYPEDYTMSFVQFLIGGGPVTDDQVYTVSALLSRSFIHKSQLMRATFEMGPSVVHLDKARFTRTSPGKYDVRQVPYDAIGLESRIKIGFPILRVFGIEAVAYSNINGLKSVYGFELNACIGLMRDKSPVKLFKKNKNNA